MAVQLRRWRLHRRQLARRAQRREPRAEPRRHMRPRRAYAYAQPARSRFGSTSSAIALGRLVAVAVRVDAIDKDALDELVEVVGGACMVKGRRTGGFGGGWLEHLRQWLGAQ